MTDRTCSFDGCVKPWHAKGYCTGHLRQMYLGRSLTPLRPHNRIVDGHKRCCRCGNQFPVTGFDAHEGRKTSACKRCRSIDNRVRLYGLTWGQVEDMLARPCDVCGTAVNGKHQHIDHCHDSGVVRGVLCHSCNTILGHVQDDPALLRRLAEYLERPRQMKF